MKIKKEDLQRLIATTLEEHLQKIQEMPMLPTGPASNVPEAAIVDLHSAMVALGNASKEMKKAGLKSVEVDDCLFKVKRLLDSMSAAAAGTGTKRV